METKLLVGNLESICLRINMGGCFGVDHEGLCGGLTLFWKFDYAVQVLSYTLGHIDFILLILFRFA